MSKYKGMFLTEAKEHLQKMHGLLADLARTPEERGAIDALFREVHSVKGMAASMGYERTASLAHHLEDLMDRFRREGAVPVSAFGHLQAGFDLLESLVEDLEGERPEREIDSFIGAAEPTAKVEDEPPAAAGPSPAAVPPAPDQLLVQVRFVAGAAAVAARAILVLRELASHGEVVASQPTAEQLRQGGAVTELSVRLRTSRTPAEIRSRVAGMTDVEQVTIAAPPEPEPSFQSRKEDVVRSVRVSTEVLDRFVDLTGELITNRYILQSAARDERLDDLREGLERQARLIGDLHHQVLRARMLPLESVTGRLPRLVRELGRKTGKEIELALEGQQVELDRAILEGLADPLMHLVRNAVDHGIEQKGKVSVRAWREKDQVIVEVADDGRGIDPAALRRKAAERGIMTAAQAKVLRDGDVLNLICIPGFSTAEQVTETSGRGVGMDVVKSAVEHLGGSLGISSAPGKGTRFQLRLPLSVAIIHLLLLESGGHLIGIPFTRVQRALDLARSEVRLRGRQSVTVIDEEEVPLLSLRKILGQPGQRPGSSIPVVLTEARGRRVALVVDRFAGQRQAFVKSLAFPLDRLPGVTGATVLGDGGIVFIIDPHSLLETRPSRPAGSKESSHELQPPDRRTA